MTTQFEAMRAYMLARGGIAAPHRHHLPENLSAGPEATVSPAHPAGTQRGEHTELGNGSGVRISHPGRRSPWVARSAL